MIPYPTEPSSSASSRPLTPLRQTPPPRSRLSPRPAKGRIPAASCPSEDFEAFIHVDQLPTLSPTPLQRATSPLAHLVRGLIPAKPRASDFQARAFQAQEHDVWRERLLREGEGMEGRVEQWRDKGQIAKSPDGITELVRGRRDVDRGAQRTDELARRSRSPSANAPARPPSIRPSQTPTKPRPVPTISVTHPPSDHPAPSSRAHEQGRPRRPRPVSSPPGHFHIESTSTDDHLHPHDHHRTEPNFQQSYDLRDRPVVTRKRDVLAHPVEALRDGRVRRGIGADEMFRSEDESGDSVREAQITPYRFSSPRPDPEHVAPRREPALRVRRTGTISASASLELPSSESEPVSDTGPSESSSGSEELYARLRKELGPEIDTCWFSFDKDGTIVVDDRNQRHRSPDNVPRDWIDIVPAHTPGGGRGVTLREISATPSYVPPPPLVRPHRPALVRTYQDAPTSRTAKRHSSFIPPSSLADQQMTAHLAYQFFALDPPVSHPSKRLSNPSPLRHQYDPLEPKHNPFAAAFSSHAPCSHPDEEEEAWEHVLHPFPTSSGAKTIGIGSLALPSVEWEKRGKWVEWRRRGDWVSWKKKGEVGLGRGKKRWERKGGEFEYGY